VLALKQSQPDGYTIGVISSLTHASAPALKADTDIAQYKASGRHEFVP
jgi:hypothetical protein